MRTLALILTACAALTACRGPAPLQAASLQPGLVPIDPPVPEPVDAGISDGGPPTEEDVGTPLNGAARR